MHQFEHHLRRTDLGRMNITGNKHHGLARAEYLVTFKVGWRAVLKVELAFELLVLVEVLYRICRADLEHDKWVVVSGLAELAHPHAIGTVGYHSHVFNDLLPSSELLVFTDSKAQELLRCGGVGGGCASKENTRRHG